MNSIKSHKSSILPLMDLKKAVSVMEAWMDQADKATTLPPDMEEQLRSAIKNVESTVKKEVDQEIEKKLRATINNRTKDAIKNHLGTTFKDLIPKSVTYESAEDDSSKSTAPHNNNDLADPSMHKAFPDQA